MYQHIVNRDFPKGWMMRKLKLQVQISVDGFIAGLDGEMDWMVWDWDEALKNYVSRLTASVDTIVLGRKLAQEFIPYWENVALDEQNPERDFGKIMTAYRRVVFSGTLPKEAPWKNVEVASEDLKVTINGLKEEDGRDIIAYGGSSFVSSLIREGLIDDYYLFVNPTILGRGLPIFQSVERRLDLKLLECLRFDCGIGLLHYQTRQAE